MSKTKMDWKETCREVIDSLGEVANYLRKKTHKTYCPVDRKIEDCGFDCHKCWNGFFKRLAAKDDVAPAPSQVESHPMAGAPQQEKVA